MLQSYTTNRALDDVPAPADLGSHFELAAPRLLLQEWIRGHLKIVGVTVRRCLAVDVNVHCVELLAPGSGFNRAVPLYRFLLEHINCGVSDSVGSASVHSELGPTLFLSSVESNLIITLTLINVNVKFGWICQGQAGPSNRAMPPLHHCALSTAEDKSCWWFMSARRSSPWALSRSSW